MIKALSEILVDLGFCATQRQANGKIKRGVVFVDNIRVANTDALLVLTRGAKICVREKDDITEKELCPCS